MVAATAGGPEVLEQLDVELPPVGPGQALVRHTAIGVNYVDVYTRRGEHGPAPTGIGIEAAGVVEETGAGVDRIAVGDRVVYAPYLPVGAYSRERVVAADRLVVLPEGLADETAAAVFEKGLTAAYLAHDVAPLPAGGVALVHGAAGGVGQLLVQWLHARGVRVIATVGTDARAAVARARGAEHVVVHGSGDPVEQIRTITDGRGVDVAFDGVGASTVDTSLRSLRRRGHLVCYGAASGPAPPLDPARLRALGSVTVTAPSLVDFVVTRDELDRAADRVFRAVRGGVLTVPPHHALGLSRAGAAHELLESRTATGPIVLLPE